MLSYMTIEPCGTIKLKSPGGGGGGAAKMHNSNLGPWTVHLNSQEWLKATLRKSLPKQSENTGK